MGNSSWVMGLGVELRETLLYRGLLLEWGDICIGCLAKPKQQHWESCQRVGKLSKESHSGQG